MGRVHRIFSRARVAGVISLGLSAAVCRGAELEHLGAPPPGIEIDELVSEPAASPLQLLGTVEPPTLVMTGKAVALSPRDAGAAARFPEAGLWVGRDRQPTAGAAGRFFFSLAGEAAAVPELDVVIRTGAGALFGATIPLGRCFLEAPLRLRVARPEGAAGAGPVFTVSGRIPAHSRLEVAGARVTPQAGLDAVNLEISPAPGRTVLRAKLIHENGTRRLINLPLRVKAIHHDPARAVLSLEPPDGAAAGKRWEFAPGERELRGRTNPGARLQLGDRTLKVEADGAFAAELVVSEPSAQLQFAVQPAGGAAATFQKRIFCPECPEAGAARAAVPDRPRAFELRRARLRHLTAVQRGLSSFSAEASWNPEYAISRKFGLGANLGAMPLRVGPSAVFAAEAELLATLRLGEPWLLEGGGGIQRWFSAKGGSSAIFSLGAGWRTRRQGLFGRSWLRPVERLTVGISDVRIPAASTFELKAGVGFGW